MSVARANANANGGGNAIVGEVTNPFCVATPNDQGSDGLAEDANSAMIMHVVHVARGSQLQTVSRLRDACKIAHRVTRAYSELRKRGVAGAVVSAGAYPLMWLSYFTLTCLRAADSVHAGVASMIAPNPISRPRRRLWRGLLLIAAVVIGFSELASASSTIVRDVVRTVGTLCVLAWLAEVCCSWKIGHRSGPLKNTMQPLRSQVPGLL